MDAKRKVLIVDDQEINRKILSKILNDDYKLYVAANGEVAMDILNAEKESIAAVLLDIGMPIMDGYDVLQTMGNDAFLSQIPVIVMTQDDSEETEVKALSLGAHDFLTKPYRPLVIKHRLANTIKLRETAALINQIQNDKLTGVYNKEFFYQKVEEMLSENSEKEYDLICGDIEKFKLVNDIFGMAVGDELLIYVAKFMRKYVDKYGFCGRLGADTFVAIIPHSENYSTSLFEKMIKKLNEFPISINLIMDWGIYYITDKYLTVSGMCDRAKLACKSINGKYEKYYAIYDDEIRQKLLDEQIITDSMKEGISENQFQIYFQPKYNIVTKQIAGAEALVRWFHPKKGFLPPGDFIPLFEKNGFITELDIYVWDKTCKIIRSWIDNGNPVIPVSVNVSRADIYHPDLAEIILSIVKKYKLSEKDLHLEITESAYTDNPTQIIEAVSKLKKLGFIIEMDDFGTGYSSLNMLSELPIDVLKLDMRFIQNESRMDNSKNILSFIVSLAKWLDLLVIAEGVETEEQVKMLMDVDCNYAQGYYYAKPMAEKEFQELLAKSEISEIKPMEGAFAGNYRESVVKIGNGDRTMMIVDDVRLNRTILKEIFKDLYTIVEAENGAVALKYLYSHKTEVDIILLDLVMPIMDGFQMLAKLKKDSELRHIPVIITAEPGENSEVKALYMGAADFIAKPYNPDIAVRRVQNTLAEANEGPIAKERELVKAKKFFNTIPVGVIVYRGSKEELTGETIFYNDIFCKLAGYDRKEYEKIYGDRWMSLIYEEDVLPLKCELENGIRERRDIDITFRIMHKDGYLVWAHFVGTSSGEDGKYIFYHCIVTDITENEKAKQTLKERIERDVLTWLYNREAIEKRVTDFFENSQVKDAMFLMIDIDNFKQVNDRRGHQMGDKALKKVATILESIFSEDSIIARMGGDEFAVFTQKITPISALETNLSMLCRKLDIEIDGVDISASVGVCLCPEDAGDYKTAYNNSDMALLMTKGLGKNGFQIYKQNMKNMSNVLSRNIEWLLDETNDAVFACDTKTYEILYLNETACVLAGMSKDDAMGRKCYDVMCKNSKPCYHCIGLEKLSKAFYEYEISTDGGTEKSYIIKSKLIEWGETKARIQYIQDNTQKALVRRSLLQTTRELQTLVEFMPGGVFRYSAEGEGIFDFVSENMLSMLGYTHNEFVEKFNNRFENMVYYKDREKTLQEINRQIEKGDMDRCKYRIETKSGELRWFLDVGHLIQDENKKKWFYVVIVDITYQANLDFDN